VTLVRIGAAVAVALVAMFAAGALERRGVVPGERGPAGPSSGTNALGPDAREIRAAREAPTPAGESLVEVPGVFTDAGGRARTLAEFRGEPFLASLVYTRCPTVCPTLIAELKRLERLPGEARPTRIVLVSLDPAHDTPDVLRAFAEAHALDPAHWTLLAPEPAALAAVARALGVASGPESGGGIAHSAVIAVVDAEGRVRRRHVGLGSPAAALAAELRAAR
jgi:protein SCO1/2